MTDHKRLFVDFSRLELSTGGPDPQVGLIAEATRDVSDEEAAWRAGCFVAVYTVGAAGALWHHVPLARARTITHEELTSFLETNWRGLPIRRERRAVWKPSKLADCLLSFREMLDEHPEFGTLGYNDLYGLIRRDARFFGRYAAMKVIEVLHRRGLAREGQTDIRPIGAWSPRKTLSLIYPESLELQHYRSDSLLMLESALIAAEGVRDVLAGAELEPSWFQIETLLCNYRQALDGKYPGRSHDRELAHFLKATEYWGPELAEWLPFYDLRKRLFPNMCLGELNGWTGSRHDLEAIFDEHGYFWCDTEFDYGRTTTLAEPVRRWAV